MVQAQSRATGTVKMAAVTENFDSCVTPDAYVWFVALESQAAVHNWTLSV